MSQPRKQRLLGFLLLLSLAVIFLPMLLDGSGYRERLAQTEIPAAPLAPTIQSYEPVNQPVPQREEIAPARPQPPAPKVEAPVSDTSEPASESATQPGLSVAAEKPVLDEEGVPVAWTIQLASFKDADNARQLEQSLNQKGYKAYLRRKGDLSKVFVGPDIQRTELERLRLQLKKEFKLDGLILRFSNG